MVAPDCGRRHAGPFDGRAGLLLPEGDQPPFPEAADFPDYLLPADLPADRQGAAGGQLHEVYGAFPPGDYGRADRHPHADVPDQDF